MTTRTITAIIGMLIVAAVGVVLWLLILAAVLHVAGCSLSLEVESQMSHHESGADASAAPTPTPAARGT